MQLQDKIKSAIRDVPDFPKPGIMFKDITPIFLDQSLCNEITNAFCEPFAAKKPDAIIGIESRGFLFGMLLANKLKVPFIPVRKKGRLPHKTVSYGYDLEYGSAVLEIHEDAFPRDAHVLIHDDLLATGGTAVAAAELVKMLGGSVAGFAFVVTLEFLNGKKALTPYSNSIKSLIQY